MSKQLVIAEKPSVAADLARALGGFKKHDDYYEREDMIISSAVGHLVELCLPGELDKKRGKWSMANLPIIPEEFALKPIEEKRSKARFNILKKLMKREDVTELVNACDAGREGELIFRYLVKLVGANKAIKRLWLQSMTADSIRAAFRNLRSDEEVQPLARAAICRSESDWLVGINSTRAMTAVNSTEGGFQLTPVGRVQTPTLAILAEREEKIRAFQPRPYWEVHAEFVIDAGEYSGRWFDEGFKKGADDDARAERLWDKEKAEAIVRKCSGKPGIVSEERKPGTQAPPLLYDLTSLQREANSRFGIPAGRALQLAQRLYERHKALSYPRTDSRYLPEDYLPTVKSTLKKLEATAPGVHAARALQSGWVKPNRRIFNNARVSDHFAIIPTGQIPESLDEAEQKIFDLVVRRFIAVFFPAAQIETTTRITRVEGEPFKSDGKVIKDPGWMAVYGREATAEGGDEKTLVAWRDDETATTRVVEVKDSMTRPPTRYTEATLLSAMEGAGKLVEDEELREAMSQRGLGTPATRAAIIEGLIKDGYVLRQGRELIATAKGLSLINLLRSIGIETLTKPELTGEWEFKLKKMELNEFPREAFMQEIRDLTRNIVKHARGFEIENVRGNYQDLEVRCPKCGSLGGFTESYRTFECKSCGYRVWKTIARRELERDEVKTLLEEGRVGPLDGFFNKIGRPFSAVLKLGDDFKPTFDFGDGPDREATPDLEEPHNTHPCPAASDGVLHEFDQFYFLKRRADDGGVEPVRINKVILQKAISPDQAIKLLAGGRTDLLPGFVSKKNNRSFKAYLVWDKEKKSAVFEFEPRTEKPKKSSAGRKIAKSKKTKTKS